jgi:hypothetical protein
MTPEPMTAEELLDAMMAVDNLLLTAPHGFPADVRIAMATRVISHVLAMNGRDQGLYHISRSVFRWEPPPYLNGRPLDSSPQQPPAAADGAGLPRGGFF